MSSIHQCSDGTKDITDRGTPDKKPCENNGGVVGQTDPNVGNCGLVCKVGRFQRKYFDFGGMFGQQIGRIVFYGLILGGSYMIYKKLKK